MLTKKQWRMSILLLAFVVFSCDGHPVQSDDASVRRALERFRRKPKLPAVDEVGDEMESINGMPGVADPFNKELGQMVNNAPPGQHRKMTVSGFFEKFGYLKQKKHPNDRHSFNSMKNAVKNFQKMYNLRPTGKLDAETVIAMVKSRCGLPDMIPPEEDDMIQALPVSKRQGPYVWSKKDLTWKINEYSASSRLPQYVQRSAIQSALQYWQNASALKFYETAGPANINMKFVWYDHGDGSQNAFDGPGGVLAHAYYPESGETHFDNAEDWTDESYDGINLKIVAAHELGHALGLSHSTVEGALMAPYYQGFEPNYKLPSDDTQRIQALYGRNTETQPTQAPKTTTTTTTTTTTRAPTPSTVSTRGVAPDTCTVNFRAITQTHDYRVYVYVGEWMWRMSEYGLDAGFPLKINSYYENAPSDIEAALFSWKHMYTYFFKGNRIWRYYGFYLVDQKISSSVGYPTSLQAAITAADGNIYLIQGINAWPFDEETMDITTPYPKQIWELFPNAPKAFDSVVKIANDPFIYFFLDNYYYKYSESERRIISGYPKLKAGPWMGPACNAAPYTPK